MMKRSRTSSTPATPPSSPFIPTIDITSSVFLAWRSTPTTLHIGELHYTNTDWSGVTSSSILFALVFELRPVAGMEGAFTFEKGDPFKLVDLESTEEVYLVPLGANVNVNANANANATKFTVSTTPDSPPSQTTYQTLLDTLDERGPCMPSNFRCISASSPPSSSSSVKFLCSWLSLGSLGAGWDLSHIPPSDLTTATGALAKHLDGEHVEGNHLLDLFRALTTSQSREGEDSVDDMIRLAS